MQVIATAGHVDHGKSTLVRAITGQDPDRLAEEHRRGLSIELGYCWTELPGTGELAFVDVPGHERFVSTMLAGVGPVPAVLFVVAADDPWMPQATEHLAALDAFDVRHGVVAITRSDLADPRPMMVQASRRIGTTSLAGSPVLAVSAVTGLGLAHLRAALAELTGALTGRDPRSPVRLWVDRRFAISGAGTVVTGTLTAGCIRVGDRLAFGDGSVRVRGMESLGRPVDRAVGVARVALRLGGHVPDDLGRGSALVTPGEWHSSAVLDVRLAAGSPDMERAVVHIGAAAVPAGVRALGSPGDVARMTLQARLPVHVGDRLVLRDPGSRRLCGAVVLDPAPPELRRRGAARRRAEELATTGGVPDLADELRRRGFANVTLLRRIGVPVALDSTAPYDNLGGRMEVSPERGGDQVAIRRGDWLLDPDAAQELTQRLLDVATAHAVAHPLEHGMTLAAAAQALGLPAAELVPALVRPPLRLADGRVVDSSTTRLPPGLADALTELEHDLVTTPFAAPDASRLAELGLDRTALAAAERAGRLLRVGGGVVLLPGADLAAVSALAELPQPFTASQARIRLGTSRRVVLPLLSFLDGRRLTRRLPDDRREVVAPPRRHPEPPSA